MLKIRVKHVSAAMVDSTGLRFVKLTVDAIRFAKLIYYFVSTAEHITRSFLGILMISTIGTMFVGEHSNA